jgi:predicted RecA/RadA family phage recombinase
MAANFIDSGEKIKVSLGSGETGYAAGLGYKSADLVGVIVSLTRDGDTVFSGSASAEGDVAVIAIKGRYNLPKETSLAIAQGDILYWDDTSKKVDKTDTNSRIGFAALAAGSSATEVEVILSN